MIRAATRSRFSPLLVLLALPSILAGCSDEDSPFGVELGTLEVLVVEADGTGIPGVEVLGTWAREGNQRQASRTTDGGGFVRIEDAEVGEWEVDVTTAVGFEAAPGVSLPHRAIVRDGETTVVEITLVPTG